MKKYNVLVVGKDGMLGSEVYRYFTEVSKEKGSCINTVWGTTIKDLDIAEYGAVSAMFGNEKSRLPDIVINCAAYTNTAECGNMTGGYQTSYRANVLGPQYLARACAFRKIKLIHISTDYVYSQFAGKELDYYHEFPANIYGCHKLLGEKMIQLEYANQPKNLLICRTSWLFGPNSNNKTFISKFLLNCYKTLADQYIKDTAEHDVSAEGYTVSIPVQINTAGRPTSTWFLSSFILNAIETKLYGICDAQQQTTAIAGNHIDAPTSRYQFAQVILEWIQNVKLEDEFIEPYMLAQHLQLKEFTIDKAKSQSEVIHPTQVPSMMTIQPHSRYKKYRECIEGAKTWESHVAAFLVREMKSNIIPWIKGLLTPEQRGAIAEIRHSYHEDGPSSDSQKKFAV